MRRIAVLASGFLLLSLAPAAPARAEEPVDVLKASPEEVLGKDPRALVDEAEQAYAAKRYGDAARAYIAALRANPGDATSIYNLACCYGLMGEAAQAARFLEACYRAGFDDATAPAKDPDFEKVRDAEPFKAALERIARWTTAKARAGGRRIAVKAEYLAEVRVVEPEGEREPHERLPLVVGLHGFGDNAANFAGLFLGRRVAQPFLFAVVETPYPFLSSSRGVGYSWELEGVPGAGASGGLSADLVLRAIEAVKREWRVDERRVFLLGFSQGAGLAYRVGLANPHLFAGVIPVGGWLDAGEHPAARMAAAKATRFLVCHSEEDRMVPFAAATAAVAELSRFEVPHDLVRYPGGHTLPEDLVRRIAAWVEDPAGAPKEPQPAK